MSNKHLHLLETIFRDPLPSNLHWREVESLLEHLGAQVEPGHGARFKVLLRGKEFTLHHPHHGNELQRQDVKHLREALAIAGVSPSRYAQEQA
ncbi:type II toxin-antitoxin system HicA family toxin [Azovibrio restrictus]|uniref:type II toxin-antitoxin system HicA family toxin n=1 Tax=Azovibrio restrictus TaxID=146938 RepID=UPI00040BC9A3|nr:type II toxin-antitoxin system HicA family toxin [Azovibrio restrictus]MCE1171138.1 type II toxin-antitoxin system HicA family toxin [Azovibrio sp.]MDD3482905.1 type II toxin-antitoxin system HicA family toxin [Azovibrio restrictus]